MSDTTQKKGTDSFSVKAFGAASATAALAPVSIRRRVPGPKDVQIDILYCGVCHSDLHQVRNEWQAAMPTVYPCVPGHEIVGRVAATGREVKAFKAGDLAAVGCMVDSCRVCPACKEGLEQYCRVLPTFTYNFEDKHLGGVTYGGYSKGIVVDAIPPARRRFCAPASRPTRRSGTGRSGRDRRSAWWGSAAWGTWR
jgi:uncharacterized zinc-type alcohol dehydrogenase-like protein